ncbi:MAG: VacB/RNase II family 3'-5' exoribonuclease [Alphaproteobacteria bacterium]|nr:VacB/RNase II family 3'-5' exoribonuclease [Alphaproteobacteria bacterium]
MARPDLSAHMVGILVKDNGALRLQPCHKRERSKLYILNSLGNSGAKEGDIVVVERLPGIKGAPKVDVTRVLGQRTSPGILTTISILEHGLKEEFSSAALNDAKAMTVPDLGNREDLRNIPLVTVDGPDSRDFDDAIFAEHTADGGMHLIVAIADVSWYVRPGSALDKVAYERGNSTYLPDRAVPMLPEDLSNGLCSLKPHVDRAVMAAHLWIDKDGNLTKKKITRGLMRSAARLTYTQLQAAQDGKPDATTAPLMNTVVTPLYEAYAILKKASQNRGALDLALPEYKAQVNDKGETVTVAASDNAESHQVIAEFMILANAAIDQLLDEAHAPCVHRSHAPPPEKKLAVLREQLKAAGIDAPEDTIKSALDFKDVTEKARALPAEKAVEIIQNIARAQSKAKYDTQEPSHFGLALERYAHFTSPIRRYADLLNHRSLAEAFNLGAGGLDAAQKGRLDDMAAHINDTELRSVKIERSADDRYAADYLSKQPSRDFKGHITGVIGGGVFIRLDGIGCEGMLPVKFLPKEQYEFDQGKKTLTGASSGHVFRCGDEMTVRVKTADGLSGAILLAPANDNKAASAAPQPKNRHKNKYKPH